MTPVVEHFLFTTGQVSESTNVLFVAFGFNSYHSDYIIILNLRKKESNSLKVCESL